MALFFIKSDKALRIKGKPLESEKQLHALIASNLEEMLGIKLLENEYPIPNGRIDTLGIDESGIPVIIEYKWRQIPGAIDQGLFYLDWIVNNKRTFDMLVREKLGKEYEIEWSMQPRLIIISEAFDSKEIAAIRQIKPTVELYKYAMYENGLFWLENVNITSRPISERKYSKVPANLISGEESEEYDKTIDGLLKRRDSSEPLKNSFYRLRELILQLGDDIEEIVPLKSMVPYYSDDRGLVWISPQKDYFRIFLRKGEYKDPNHRIVKKESWGNYPEIRIHGNPQEIEDVINLIKQAYELLK